jgi:hypothetical protein
MSIDWASSKAARQLLCCVHCLSLARTASPSASSAHRPPTPMHAQSAAHDWPPHTVGTTPTLYCALCCAQDKKVAALKKTLAKRSAKERAVTKVRRPTGCVLVSKQLGSCCVAFTVSVWQGQQAPRLAVLTVRQLPCTPSLLLMTGHHTQSAPRQPCTVPSVVSRRRRLLPGQTRQPRSRQ